MATMEEYGSVASRKDCPAANSAPEKGLPTYRKLKLEQLRCEVGAGLADLEAGRLLTAAKRLRPSGANLATDSSRRRYVACAGGLLSSARGCAPGTGEEEATGMLRLFVDAGLREGASVPLDGGQVAWLGRVMRRRAGERLALFNGRDGEWEAEVAALERGSGRASVLERLRPQAASPDIWLAFAPAKRGMVDLAVRQAVELGAARILPVIAERSVVDRLNRERLGRIAVEAAEQCGRLDVPEVAPLAPLRDLLAEWPAERPLAACHPGGGKMQAGPPPGGLLLGPEGGFAAAELDALAETGFVRLVDLGPRILRAETAVVAALSMRQAIWGDGA